HDQREPLLQAMHLGSQADQALKIVLPQNPERIRLDVHRGNDAVILSALFAWRATQGIYHFDPTLAAELQATPLTGSIPVEVLQNLPEWCTYLAFPEHPERQHQRAVINARFIWLFRGATRILIQMPPGRRRQAPMFRSKRPSNRRGLQPKSPGSNIGVG